MISAVGRVRLALNHSLNTFSLALKRRLIVAPLKLLTGRLAQVFATGFALGDGGRLNGLNRAGVGAADTVVLIPLAVGAWVGGGGIVLGGLRWRLAGVGAVFWGAWKISSQPAFFRASSWRSGF